MNKGQAIASIAVAVVIFSLLIYTPHLYIHHKGQHINIFALSHNKFPELSISSIDKHQLLAQWLGVFIAWGMIVFVLKDKKE